MRQSKLFTKTKREAPKDEVSKNAILLSRAGFIHKELAGAYAYLPLGLRVIKKIEQIIREEMNAIDGQELEMTALQEKETWEKSGRWSDEVVDVWFKTQLKSGSDIGLATTHEEPLTALLSEYVSSYRDLPFSVYQFQTKFRNELRAKSGIMRGREFLMKDLYSFSRNEAEHLEFYEKASEAYKNIFNRVGLGQVTYLTSASGGSFSKFSHEFQTLTDAGEDIIYISKEDENKGLNMASGHSAINKEIYEEKENFVEKKAVEVGNIFTLGTRFSEPLNLYYNDENGDKHPVFMGSYGIGLGRVMGTVVEVLSDEKGMVWPKSIAPFRAHLVLVSKDERVKDLAEEIYKNLMAENIEVLFDDRDLRAGEKFADSDLIGIPTRIVIGDRAAAGGLLEVKDRKTGETSEVTLSTLIAELKN